MTETISFSDYRYSQRRVYFNRSELALLLALYSERVARGEWRDYAIDHDQDAAVFSVFRHSDAMPLFTVAKLATSANRPPEYLVRAGRRRLRRGLDLAEVLTVFDLTLRQVFET
ncbi:MAG: DUF2794 domain-containing protein [Azospirillum sp.]|nr:DUF2794 domain-containing protein [Azospirillum sp.]